MSAALNPKTLDPKLKCQRFSISVFGLRIAEFRALGFTFRRLEGFTVLVFTHLWLAGNEGMEKKMDGQENGNYFSGLYRDYYNTDPFLHS